jgi:hypothetical protein
MEVVSKEHGIARREAAEAFKYLRMVLYRDQDGNKYFYYSSAET